MAAKKVIVLHGYAHSAAIFSKKLAALRKACGEDVDLVFVDAPHILAPADLAHEPRLEDFGAANAAEADPALAPRGWWWADPTRAITAGLEDSIRHLRDALAKDRYDGIFGFSQGAAMAALMTALLERPQLYPPVLVDGKPPHPPFTFCIAAAGYKPRNAICDVVLETPYSTPTLHILGRNDVVIGEETSKTLINMNTNRRIEYHDGGHFVPSKTSWRIFLKAYMLDPLGDVPSPSRTTASQPPSGAATPMTPDYY
ncbi:FSH1-domain-containing protein [Trametes gibbosa]|nr:FSH1-domain-containing protein [Trametes gibbosa]